MKRFSSALALIIFSLALILTTILSTGKEDTAGLKLGVAISTSISSSTDAAENENGKNSTTITVASVLVDASGKVVSCKIDVVNAEILFTSSGTIVTDLEKEVLSKKELGYDYGMKEFSSIQKEWHEQVTAFENYCVGKTAAEITGIAVNQETGLVDGLNGCTMHPAQFQYLVADAINAAQPSNATSADHLGLAITVDLKNSTNASADANGSAEVTASIAATAIDAEGKMTAVYVDVAQAIVNFDITGKITNDVTKEVLSKHQLKDAYGMKAFSSIQKEWYEQADAFAAYCIGKTANDMYSITVNQETGLVDGLSGCTMHPGNFQYIIAKAAQSAIQ